MRHARPLMAFGDVHDSIIEADLPGVLHTGGGNVRPAEAERHDAGDGDGS